MRKSVYIVITHIYQPINTPGPNKGKVNVREQIEFVDSLKNRQIDSATAILDILNEKMVKNRATEAEFPHYIGYLDEKYPKQMQHLYETLGLTRIVVPTPEEVVADEVPAKKVRKTKKVKVETTEEVAETAPVKKTRAKKVPVKEV